MKKKVAAMVLGVYLTGALGTAYASPANSVQGQNGGSVQNKAVVSIEVIKDSAGILPDSIFYSLERKLEKLQTAITQTEERLASLKAEYATERAAEAAVMMSEGEEELAGDATDEYLGLLASATEHLNKAIEAKDDSVKTLENLNEAHKRSEQILKTVLEKAPEEARAGLEKALEEQDKAISVLNGFQAAKAAFSAAKDQLKEAKRELQIAKKSGDAEAIRTAEEKVKAAEALKDELEALKGTAKAAKEEVKRLMKQAENRTKLGMKQIDRANKKLDKLEEKVSENEDKSEDKAKRLEQKEERKARKQVFRNEEKAEKGAEKEVEKARKEAWKAERGDRKETQRD